MCEICGGPLVLLGILGNLAHLRCQNCGMGCSQNAEDIDIDEEEDED